MEFTKGEWKLGSLEDKPFARSCLSIYREDGRKIAEISREGFMAFEEAEDNAHLLAVAPDLYEALKFITTGKRQDGKYDKHDAAGFIRIAEDAVAEAGGR